MIRYTIASSTDDLHQILELQQLNLKRNLSPKEIEEQGFVTVEHTYNQLLEMHEIEPHLVIKDGDKVLGYILSMTPKSSQLLPILYPMFEQFNSLEINGSKIRADSYIVIGQVCLSKVLRGKGIFLEAYNQFKALKKERFKYILTEISGDNVRSLKAHLKVGFRQIKQYYDQDYDWRIVIWEL